MSPILLPSAGESAGVRLHLTTTETIRQFQDLPSLETRRAQVGFDLDGVAIGSDRAGKTRSWIISPILGTPLMGMGC